MTKFSKALKELGIDASKIRRNKTLCPNCSHDRKRQNQRERCLWVNLKSGNYHCHNQCGFAGRMDSDEWLDGVYERANASDYNKEPDREYLKPKDRASEQMSPEVRAYLHSRGITDQVIDHYRVGSRQGKEVGVVCLRFYDDGELMKVKYRAATHEKRDRNFFQEADCRPTLYGVDNIKDSEIAIVTEGEIDVLSWATAGIYEAVGLDAGAYDEPKPDKETGQIRHIQLRDAYKFDCIAYAAGYFLNKRIIYIAMDNDAPGRYTTGLLVKKFGADRVRIVEYPEGCKDANDVLQVYGPQEGPQKLHECLENARRPKLADIVLMEDVAEELWDKIESGENIIASTSYMEELDGHFSWVRGWPYVWTGHPQHGKSQMLQQLIVLKCFYEGDVFAVFSPESGSAKDYYEELVRVASGRGTIAGMKNCITLEEYKNVSDWINKHFIFIHPEEVLNLDQDKDQMQDPKWILKKIRELVLVHGIDGFIIDPWNQLDHPQVKREDMYISYWIKQFTAMAKLHDLYDNIIVHPRRMDSSKERPTAFNLSGGPMWNNKASFLGVIHRPNHWQDKNDREVEFHIEKAKKQWMFGKPDTIRFMFNPKTLHYWNISESYSAMTSVAEAIREGRGPDERSEKTVDLFEQVDKMEVEQPVSYYDTPENNIITRPSRMNDDDDIPF